MRFAKMHGLGNDFIVINGFAEEMRADWGPLAQKVCRRQFGVGADGMIVLAPAETAAAQFIFHNADGSRAESCGNGLRCAALFARLEGIVDTDKFTFELLNGSADVEILDLEKGMVRVDLGRPSFRPETIPAKISGSRVVSVPLELPSARVRVTLVSVGNPHCVVFVDDVDSYPVEKIGPQIEQHELFPHKINAEFVQMLDDDHCKMRVWERGVGETYCCGTGAAASMLAAQANGYCGDELKVIMRYGLLQVSRKEEHVLLEGPAVLVGYIDYRL